MPARSRQISLPGLEDAGLEDAGLNDDCPDESTLPATPPAEHAGALDKSNRMKTNPPASLAGQTVWGVDANNLVFQVFHALPEMSSPAGEPVNAVYGFARDLLQILKRYQPTYIFCAFDLPGPTFRHELYEPYKADRGEMPEELASQFPKIRRMVEALGIPILDRSEFEADDVLATIARVTGELSGECVLVSGDKDCRQLITHRTKIFNVRKEQFYDAENLQADWGIRPDQVVDFQSLVGDKVDNVPGVPLIGPKIAGQLLATYETLEGVLDHAEEISGKKRSQNLIEYRDQALLSRKLVRLDPDVPLKIDWDRGRVEQRNTDQALELCTEFGFHRLREMLHADGQAPARPEWQSDYRMVATSDELAAFVKDLSAQKRISLDTETTSVTPTQAEIVGYSFCWKEGQAYYLPVRAPAGEPCLDPRETLEALRPVLENPQIEKVGQNLKYEIVVLRCAGVRLAGTAFDTMLASYLLDAGERNHSLDELSARYLDHATIKISQLIGTGKNQKRMDEVPVAQVTDYAAEDADVPWRLYPILRNKLEETGLDELFDSLEIPLIDVLAEMEFNGIRVDVGRLEELSTQYGASLVELEKEVYELAGHEFNIGSPKQLQQVLFVEQGLPVLKRTKTGPSTDVSVLEELALQHPLPAKIIEYRQFAKLKNTYVDALPKLVNPRTGRVHASFHQAVAATGRLSSSDPNLQNIPIRTQSGREIRSAFLPGHDGWRLLAADYSQIELRVLAHFSADRALCDAFAADEDIHALVASEVYDVAIDDVTPQMRRGAKAVNFGVVYGQSAFGLAKQLGIEQQQAADFIEAYFERYRGVDEFLTKILADARQNGYVSTILGRRRAIQGVRPDAAGRQRNLPERTAINTVIQGSAADLIKRAMIAVHRRLRDQSCSAKMLLQIHDELIFELPSGELEQVATLVAAEMASGLDLSVPLKVDIKSGRNWAEVEPWG